MRHAFFLSVMLCVDAFGWQGKQLRLIEVDPGHSHAAALHTTMLAGFSAEAHVYAPLGTDLTAHLNRIGQFNNRVDNPTKWSLSVYAGPDYLQKMRQESPGNVVVLSGRNRPKMEYIETALKSGQNVLADKPWIIESGDLPRLEAALNLAESKGLIAYDCMTQRFDAAYRLQRELVSDREIFGEPAQGTPDSPAIQMRNLHALYKKPSLRPAWFFDIRQQGEGIADVGTHLVDLLEWTAFRGRPIHYRHDVQVLQARHWPTVLTRWQFEQVTGEKAWPEFLRDAVKQDRLQYFTNNETLLAICGVHASVKVEWEYEAEPGTKDSYFASYQGTKCKIELREGAAEKYIPEVYLIPGKKSSEMIDHLRKKYGRYTFEENGDEIHIVIPKGDRTPDSEYFALLADRFLGYVRNPRTLPAWEKPNMIAKYYITTRAVELARKGHS